MNKRSSTPTNESLMAFADRELDAAQRTEVEKLLQANPGLYQRMDEMQQQRNRVGNAFASVLDEPVPDRLAQLLRSSPRMPAAAAEPAPVVVRAAPSRRPYRPNWQMNPLQTPRFPCN